MGKLQNGIFGGMGVLVGSKILIFFNSEREREREEKKGGDGMEIIRQIF